MAVRIRMKKMGRKHRPFFRICAMDARAPRDGKVIEELGYYDPMVKETDARAVLKTERLEYWLGVGAQPTEKVAVLIKKYGSNGTHLEQQQAAFDRLKIRPEAPPPVPVELPRPEAAAEASQDGGGAAPDESGAEASGSEATGSEPTAASEGAEESATE